MSRKGLPVYINVEQIIPTIIVMGAMTVLFLPMLLWIYIRSHFPQVGKPLAYLALIGVCLFALSQNIWWGAIVSGVAIVGVWNDYR